MAGAVADPEGGLGGMRPPPISFVILPLSVSCIHSNPFNYLPTIYVRANIDHTFMKIQ